MTREKTVADLLDEVDQLSDDCIEIIRKLRLEDATSNRYNELSKTNRIRIDGLINTLASGIDFADAISQSYVRLG